MTRKTIIITGLVSQTTELLVRDLDRFCDAGTRIIVSAWEGSKIDVSDIERCDIVFVKDPGVGPRGNFERMLFSAVAGLDFIKNAYEPKDRGIVLKIRSDFKCTKDPFTAYRDIPIVDKSVSKLSSKVWIDSRWCSYHNFSNNGKIKKWNPPSYPTRATGISDWTCMGKHEDVREWYTLQKHSTKDAGGYDELAKHTMDCDSIFFLGNLSKFDDSPHCNKRSTSVKFAKKFLDENVYFYSLPLDLGMICYKWALGIRFIDGHHALGCSDFHTELFP
tara:strand:+ start:810 stop:1637 length:828 start_codon:yes stop_codon:yes gene_type:complete